MLERNWKLKALQFVVCCLCQMGKKQIVYMKNVLTSIMFETVIKTDEFFFNVSIVKQTNSYEKYTESTVIF